MLARPQDDRLEFFHLFSFFPIQVNDDFRYVRQNLTTLTDSLLSNISSLEFSHSMVSLTRFSNLYINCRLSK